MGGLEFAEWFCMYAHTHTGTDRIDWPNGGSYLGQYILLIDIWGIITGEALKYRKEQDERN